MHETADEALHEPAGRVVSSMALPSGSGFLRVFATRFDDATGAPAGAVAVLVDVAPLLAPLDVVVKDGNSRLLVFGPHGRPFPSSDPRLNAQAAALPAASLDVVIEQTDRVSRTIRELLDFARPQAACTQAVSVETVFHSVRSLLDVEADRRRRRLVVLPAPDALLEADEHQLHQVLVNLVLNGFDACADGGTVTLQARVESQTTCEILVSDDGAGIPQEQVPRIFDPFWTTKRRGHGTGLGLAVVEKVVRNHSASIEVTSHVGAGTTFRLRWPLHGAERERGAA